MEVPSYSASRGLRIGAVGGVAGSIVLGVFAVIGSVAMGQEVFYVTIARKLGFGDSSVIGGWVMHFVVGIVAGAVFVALTAFIRKLALTTLRNSLLIGLLGGWVIWVIVYVPVTLVLVPADLTSATFAVGSLVLHMVFGIVTAVVALSAFRRSRVA
ncbi:MAG TPA: hypothetical protein VFE98_10040 [Candidatus Bathyarchaeia archaeon]|nr:hypothetical protein [Candidatus Bathyarchaeia archaeon]